MGGLVGTISLAFHLRVASPDSQSETLSADACRVIPGLRHCVLPPARGYESASAPVCPALEWAAERCRFARALAPQPLTTGTPPSLPRPADALQDRVATVSGSPCCHALAAAGAACALARFDSPAPGAQQSRSRRAP